MLTIEKPRHSASICNSACRVCRSNKEHMFQDSATFPGNPGDWRKKLTFKEDVRAGDTQTQKGKSWLGTGCLLIWVRKHQ